MGPTQPPIALCQGIQQPEREAERLRPCRTEVKISRISASMPLHLLCMLNSAQGNFASPSYIASNLACYSTKSIFRILYLHILSKNSTPLEKPRHKCSIVFTTSQRPDCPGRLIPFLLLAPVTSSDMSAVFRLRLPMFIVCISCHARYDVFAVNFHLIC